MAKKWPHRSNNASKVRFNQSSAYSAACLHCKLYSLLRLISQFDFSVPYKTWTNKFHNKAASEAVCQMFVDVAKNGITTNKTKETIGLIQHYAATYHCDGIVIHYSLYSI